MKLLHYAFILLLFSCGGEPDSIYETDKSDTISTTSTSAEEELEVETVSTRNEFINDGERECIKDLFL